MTTLSRSLFRRACPYDTSLSFDSFHADSVLSLAEDGPDSSERGRRHGGGRSSDAGHIHRSGANGGSRRGGGVAGIGGDGGGATHGSGQPRLFLDDGVEVRMLHGLASGDAFLVVVA